MPTATDIDNRPVAIGKWPRLRGSSNRNAATISSNHALNRRNRAIANANSNSNNTSFERTGRPIGSPEDESAKNWDEQSAKDSWSANASNGKHKDWCTLDNCISNCDDDNSNPCIDVLLNPELLQEFYGDKCLTSANPLLEFCLDGGLSRKFPFAPTSEAVQDFSSAFASSNNSSLENIVPSLPADPVFNTLASLLPAADHPVSNTLASSLSSNPIIIAEQSAKNQSAFCTTTTKTQKLHDDEEIISILPSSISNSTTSFNNSNFLLSHCSSCSNVFKQVQTCSDKESQFVSQLRMHLRQTGCDINVQDSQGFTALHHLIQGCSKENFAPVVEAAELLLSQLETCNPNIYDLQDHNSPLTGLHMLLDRNLPQSSLVKLANLLLAHDFDANHINGHERTLLTYSVSKGDLYLDLTKLLLNHGALILPARSNIVRDRSAFTWLVRSLMKEQSLDGHRETILLLCQNMAEVDGPEAMRSHTLSTMIHLGHSASVMGPLFTQLRSLIAPFWSQPLDLVHLCRNSIRRSLGPKNISLGVTQLNLPPSLSQYLHYYFQE